MIVAARVFTVAGVAMCAYGFAEIAKTQPERALILALGVFAMVLVIVVVSEL